MDERVEQLLNDLYQIVGCHLDPASRARESDYTRVLDNITAILSGEKPPHDLLPWPHVWLE